MSIVKIENKNVSFEEGVNYSKLLISVLPDFGNERGFDLDAIESIVRIRKVLDEAKEKEEFEIDKNDFRKLKEKVISHRWLIAHQDIIDFVYYIKELK